MVFQDRFSSIRSNYLDSCQLNQFKNLLNRHHVYIVFDSAYDLDVDAYAFIQIYQFHNWRKSAVGG